MSGLLCIVTEADIKAYVAGNLSVEERQAIERLISEDDRARDYVSRIGRENKKDREND